MLITCTLIYAITIFTISKDAIIIRLTTPVPLQFRCCLRFVRGLGPIFRCIEGYRIFIWTRLPLLIPSLHFTDVRDPPIRVFFNLPLPSCRHYAVAPPAATTSSLLLWSSCRGLAAAASSPGGPTLPDDLEVRFPDANGLSSGLEVRLPDSLEARVPDTDGLPGGLEGCSLTQASSSMAWRRNPRSGGPISGSASSLPVWRRGRPPLRPRRRETLW
jgi:hypothetical protein